MNRSVNSDVDATMLATQYFESILYQIQNSALNFQIQLSPFGAGISLKKSFTKDKKGTVVIPSLPLPFQRISSKSNDVEILTRKNLELEDKLFSLKNEFAAAVDDCAAAQAAVEVCTIEKNKLENEIKLLKNNIEDQDEPVINSQERNEMNTPASNSNPVRLVITPLPHIPSPPPTIRCSMFRISTLTAQPT